MVKFGYFASFWQSSQKLSDNLYFLMKILGDDIDQPSWDGFDLIVRRIILKVGKVRFAHFSMIIVKLF